MHNGIMSFSENRIHSGNKTTLIKPFVEISRKQHTIILDFDLNEYSSVKIFSKRGLVKDYELLDEVTSAPFIDERGNLTKYSETREYMVIYCLNGKSIGEADYVEIKTKGQFKFW